MRYIVLLLTIAILAVGLNTPPSPVNSGTNVRHLTPCTSIPDRTAFIRALHDHIAQDEVMPPSGQLALASLHIGTPTFAFRPNHGAVLKFNILNFPGPTEAHQTAALLIGVGVSVAEAYHLCLSGIEVAFYQDKRRLGLVITAVPPWSANQISIVPLGRRGD